MAKQYFAKRARTPTILQMETIECGAVCLGIILSYFGKNLPLEQLRLDCDTSRDGSNADNIMRAASQHGLKAKTVKLDIDDLHRLEPPYIVFWQMNHFVVVEGFTHNKVFINDPSVGRLNISHKLFNQSYMGVCILLKPGKHFEKGGYKTSIVEPLWSRLAQNKSTVTYLILIGLCLVIPALSLPIFAKIFVDNYLVQNIDGWVKPLLIGMTLTLLFRLLLTWIQQKTLLRMENKLAIYNESAFFWHILKLPTLFFEQRYAGDLAYRVHLNDSVAMTLSRKLARALINIILIFFFTLLLAYYDIALTAIVLFIALINIAILLTVNRLRYERNKQLTNERSKLMGTVMNGFNNIETLKANGGENDLFNRWAGLNTNVINISQKMDASTNYLIIIPPALAMITTGIILAVGGYDIIQGQLTIGTLVAIQTISISLLRPLEELINIAGDIQKLHGDIVKLDDVLDYKVDKFFRGHKLPLSQTNVTGKFELKNVTFGYSKNSEPTIKNFSLTIRPGERIALVGHSGSGKSTIAHLMLGLYHPWKGEVLLDEISITDYEHLQLANHIGMVEQTTHLFEGTIYENISMWDSSISEDDIINASKDAEIHTVITARHHSYNGIIQTNGTNFSGGEKQRLEIARSLVRNPKVLVLDEATSALDCYTEDKISSNIKKRACATLIISQRLSTIRDCDLIIILDNGETIASGSHKELIKNSSCYRELVGK